MADKNIGSLPAAAVLDDDSLLIAEQQGEAVQFRGKLLKDYARQGIDALVAAARVAAEQALKAAQEAERIAAGIQDVSDDVELAVAAAQVAENARVAAVQAAQAAEQAAAMAAEDAAREAAQEAVGAVGNQMAGYVSAAQAAQRAAEQARDEAQSIAGGNFASTTYVDNKVGETLRTAKEYTDEKLRDADFDVTADEVKFSDGQTFQQKYDSGELNGPTGSTGAPGKTPVRGEDYWTEDDIAEIKSYVDAAILNGVW